MGGPSPTLMRDPHCAPQAYPLQVRLPCLWAGHFPSPPGLGGLLLRCEVREEFCTRISQFSGIPTTSLLPAEILTGAPFSFLGALAQAARRTGRRGRKTWKGFCGLGFSVMDPNRTLKAKPVTVLKGRGRKRRRRRKIPIKEAETTGRSRPPVNVAQPVDGWARLPESS